MTSWSYNLIVLLKSPYTKSIYHLSKFHNQPSSLLDTSKQQTTRYPNNNTGVGHSYLICGFKHVNLDRKAISKPYCLRSTLLSSKGNRALNMVKKALAFAFLLGVRACGTVLGRTVTFRLRVYARLSEYTALSYALLFWIFAEILYVFSVAGNGQLAWLYLFAWSDRWCMLGSRRSERLNGSSVSPKWLLCFQQLKSYVKLGTPTS